MLKRFLMLALLLSFIPASFATSNQSPYEQTQVAARRLFTTFDNKKSEIQEDPTILKSLVRENLLPYIQIKYSGALILGQDYKTVSTRERTAYFNAFEKYLVHALAQTLSFYKGQTYSTESPKDLTGKNLVSVRVILTSKDKNVAPIRLDFQWRKNSRTGEWKAYDMIAEGISMISTKQNEWATTLRTDGIQGLTKQLEREARAPIKPNQK